MREAITTEMLKHYYKRTEHHIDLVKKWYEMIIYEFPIYNRIDINDHDLSKYSDPELTPYIYLTWNYHCKDNNIPFTVSDQLQEKINEATLHHRKNNKHHPEFWDKNFDSSMFNSINRDEVGESMVDATEMPIRFILELLADWCAVSEEKKTNPFDWAKKNIGIRWKFDKYQVDIIYRVLNKFWKED